MRRNLRHVATAHEDAARARLFQPRDQPQKRGLAAARGADEDAELAVRDRKRDVAGDRLATEGLGQVFDPQLCHGYPFTAPATIDPLIRRYMTIPAQAAAAQPPP